MSNPHPRSVFPTFQNWGFRGRSFRLERPSPTSWRIRPWWLCETANAYQQTLLRLLTTVHEERLEPAPLINALAEEHRGWYRRRLKRLANRLRRGTALIDALEQTPGALNPSDTLALRIALQTGTLGPTLKELLRGQSTFDQETRILYGQTFAYFVASLLAIGVVAVFLNTLIRPNFAYLSVAIDGKPWITSADVWFQRLPWILLATATLLLVYRSLSGRISWSLLQLSPLYKIRRRRRYFEIGELLAKTLASGRPLPGTLSSLARYHDDPYIRRQLLLARNEIELGVPLWDSLRQAKIIPPRLASTLIKTESSSVQSWILHQYFTTQKHSHHRQRRLTAQFLHPLCILICGLLVLWITKTYFSFLTHLILGWQ